MREETQKTFQADVRAVVLAGAENEGPLSEVSDEKFEAMIRLDETTLLEHVVQACSTSKHIDEITVVGYNEFCQEENYCYQLVSAGKTFIDSLQQGLKGAGDADYLLYCTADAPLITGEALDDFIDRCSDAEKEFYACVVKKAVVKDSFGDDVERTWANLREGQITLGCCFLGSVDAIRKVIPVLKRLHAVRKNLFKMAWILGLKFILKYLLRQAGLEDIENLFARTLRVRGQAVLSPYAEMAHDIDKPQDLEAARRWMDSRV